LPLSNMASYLNRPNDYLLHVPVIVIIENPATFDFPDNDMMQFASGVISTNIPMDVP